MKVVFKVCCAPETDSQNITLSSENGHTNNDSKVNQVSHQNGVKLNQYPQNNRGTSINTDTQSMNNDGRVPTLTINTNNGGGNFAQSTMTWLSRNGDSYGGGGGGGNYPHSTPITSTVAVQQYYPHPTSSRPFINSAINKNNKNNNIYNKNNSNNNYNHSNYAPSHKPTKKTSKKICIFPISTQFSRNLNFIPTPLGAHVPHVSSHITLHYKHSMSPKMNIGIYGSIDF